MINKLIDKHIEKSFARLCEKEYQLPDVYKPLTYTWQGDWEGRALLAYCCLYSVTGKKNPAMDEFIKVYPEKCNEEGYLGKLFDAEEVDEQQLSGHNWLISGMVEYYKLFGDKSALKHAENIFNNLYKKATASIENYPVKREKANVGGVSGTHTGLILNKWRVSSDVGCVSMCIDGVSRYYEVTKDESAKAFLDTTIDMFYNFDKRAARAQTHTTLTATRGIFRMYKVTGDKEYYNKALDIFNLYLEHGMTYTYENFNWFERKDTWTEPCAVVDSFMLADMFYEETGDKKYLTLLRRIFFNGLNHCHRDNGGVGTSKTVYEENNYAGMGSHYEAAFCCTMRYCEGLVTINKNRDKLAFNQNAPIIKDELGRRFKDDALVIQNENGEDLMAFDLAFQEKNDRKYKVF